MPGSVITRAEAKNMILLYQSDQAPGSIKGGKFQSSDVLSILNQQGCVALRYYFAKNSAGENTLVLVGEDSSGTALSNGILVNNPPPCPPFCPGDPPDH